MAKRPQQTRLGRQRRETEDRCVRTEHGARMRFERQHQRACAETVGLRPRRLQQSDVTGMHAIEVADGNRAAGQRGGNGIERERYERLAAGA